VVVALFARIHFAVAAIDVDRAIAAERRTLGSIRMPVMIRDSSVSIVSRLT